MEKLTFAIENISNIEDSADPAFANVTIDAFASGTSNGLYISEETLRRCGESILESPIVFAYDDWTGNLKGHEREEIPGGFIPASSKISYNKSKDGSRTFLSVSGKIWKKYSGKLMEVLKRDGGKKAVSVEMEVFDFDKIKSEIRDFAIRAITIIGVEPAVKDAQLTVLSFSKDKENYYKMFEDKESIKINNSKKAAVFSSTWGNPGRKLYQRLLEKSNKLSLLKEAYLVVDESKIDTAPSEALSYPHHTIKNGELVVNSKGIQSAFARARQQGVARGEVLSHIRKHYEELNLDMSNFSTENFEEQEVKELEEEKVMMETEPVNEPEQEKPESEETEPEKEEVDYEAKIAEMQAKLDEFGCGEKAYEEKIQNYEAELTELRKYKSDREAQDMKYEVEKLFSEVGEKLPEDKSEEFRTKAESLTLAEFSAFSNEVKACTYDFVAEKINEKTTPTMATTTPEPVSKAGKLNWGL